MTIQTQITQKQKQLEQELRELIGIPVVVNVVLEFQSEIRSGEMVLRDIAALFKVDEADILSQCRRRELTEARMLYCHYLHNTRKICLSEIARMTGKNHSTVIHSLKTYDILHKSVENFRFKCDQFFKIAYL